MADFGDVLQGYAIPQLLPMVSDGKGGWEKQKPIGDTGITVRILQITYAWAVSQTFRRRRFWYFGHTKMSVAFQTLQNSIELAWMAEVLRILDKAKTNTPTGKRENLTIRLCHDRFQTSLVPTTQQKLDEQAKYEALISVYDQAELEELRNRAIFHLDYEEHQLAPRSTGDIGAITDLLTDWFLSVAMLHYRHADPFSWVLTSTKRGQLVGRHYRRMMVMYYRNEMGRPSRRRLSPKNIKFFSHLRVADVPSESVV